VALRLATNREVHRKLQALSGSRFFWVYSLSLWDMEAFWKCISGAAAFALIGLGTMSVLTREFTPLLATTIFEYFLLGLILMWLYNLGPWVQPTNLIVISTFLFRLYRKNKTVDDLTAEEFGRLFPHEILVPGWRGRLTPVLLRVRRSPVLGSLLLGSLFAVLMVGLLVMSS
jgi:hypothetical protein